MRIDWESGLIQLTQELHLIRDTGNPDYETGHSDADEILLRALYLTASHTPHLELVEDLIAVYRSVPKWYA